MTVVAARHTETCGRTFALHPHIAGYLNSGVWKAGLDCPYCNIYRPIGAFDLLDQDRWDEAQEHLLVPDHEDEVPEDEEEQADAGAWTTPGMPQMPPQDPRPGEAPAGPPPQSPVAADDDPDVGPVRPPRRRS